ncbi:MAG: aminoglycoside phosphotransferase family protein [Chloroflexota bacterium]
MYIESYIESIRTHYPDLDIKTARYHDSSDGQFNVILWVNEEIVFRFPHSVETAETFMTEIKLLTYLRPHLSLPIPHPQFQHPALAGTLEEGDTRLFMGYYALPGKPFWRETLDAIEDETVLDHLAAQLAGFLKELHSIPADAFDMPLVIQDVREDWVKMYDDFRTYLYPYMRPDAQAAVTANFEKFLNDPTQFDYVPAFRHGDFGPGNILYDADNKTISGIIDFDSIGLGDPAVDVGAVLTLGEPFFARMCRVYPEMATYRPRVAFYQSTYALQEALYGLRDNVMESFEAGIADYR